MQEGQLLMTQAERDRLVALKKAKKKLITQREAAEDLGITGKLDHKGLKSPRGRARAPLGHYLSGRYTADSNATA
jgi:hypothetical protein